MGVIMSIRDIFKKTTIVRSEAINGSGFLSLVHYYRWVLFQWGDYRIYLHHFINSDGWEAPHDHPKTFISIGLWGSYREHIYGSRGKYLGSRIFRAPWIRKFPATHIHRIEVVEGCTPAWTICLTGRVTRRWGFWKLNHPYKRKRGRRRWVYWEKFVEQAKNGESGLTVS